MIYMDPPYGIKFGSNWQTSTRDRDVKDGKLEDVAKEPEQLRAFRDTWALGIHSYLSYLRDRLMVARELLTEEGSIFVQIGDENVHRVRCLMDEVFGTENFCAQIVVQKTTGQTSELLAGTCDYLLWFASNTERVKFRRPLLTKSQRDDNAGVYRWLELADGTIRRLRDEEVNGSLQLPNGSRVFRLSDLTSQRPPGDFPVEFEGQTYGPGKGYWKTGMEGMPRLVKSGRVARSGASLAYKRYFKDFEALEIGALWTDT